MGRVAVDFSTGCGWWLNGRVEMEILWVFPLHGEESSEMWTFLILFFSIDSFENYFIVGN